MDAKGKTSAGAAAKPSRPWGQALLRAKAQEMLRSGSLAPSAVMGNLLAASAAPTVDVEMLSAQPRPMSVEANRIIADALRRSRLPHADVAAILDELILLAWRPKTAPKPAPSLGVAPRNAPRPAGGGKKPAAPKPLAASVAVGASPKAQPKAPIIVRRVAKLSPPKQ